MDFLEKLLKMVLTLAFTVAVWALGALPWSGPT